MNVCTTHQNGGTGDKPLRIPCAEQSLANKGRKHHCHLRNTVHGVHVARSQLPHAAEEKVMTTSRTRNSQIIPDSEHSAGNSFVFPVQMRDMDEKNITVLGILATHIQRHAPENALEGMPESHHDFSSPPSVSCRVL